MTILRIQKKEKNFVVLDKGFINDINLSMRARGLMTYLLSLPNNWEVKVRHLLKMFPEGKHVVYGVIKELRKSNYILYSICRNEKGAIIKGEYTVFEDPQIDNGVLPRDPCSDTNLKNELVTDFQDEDIQNEVYQDEENQDVLINNKYTKNLNNKIITAANCAFTQNSASTNLSSMQLAAADFLIGEKLTESQQTEIEQAAKNLQHHCKNSANLAQEIAFVMLSIKSFTQCGDDFYKKLNAIKKTIRESKWRKPVGMVQKSVELKSVKTKDEKRIECLEIKKRDLLAEMKNSPLNADPNMRRQWHKEMVVIDEEMKTLYAKINSTHQFVDAGISAAISSHSHTSII